MSFLKHLRRLLLELLLSHFSAQSHYSYYLFDYKKSSSVALRKPCIANYSAPAAQWLLALLNILKKGPVLIVASKIPSL
jgi:hypothetical protein